MDLTKGRNWLSETRSWVLESARKVYPDTRWQRCWVHKTANVLNKLPKSLQAKAKDKLHQIWMAPEKDEAQRHFDEFVQLYNAKYPKAVECLQKDHEELLTFYDFPAGHGGTFAPPIR